MTIRALSSTLVRRVIFRDAQFSIPNASFHTSEPLLKKKKKIFYNKYIEQLRRSKKIYTGFAYEVLQKQEERTHTLDDENDDVDYNEELLKEGRKRQQAYIHSRRMRQVHKGPGPRLLTWDQMEHVRFLRQTDPDEWDVRTLAHSFQVPEQVIRKVLRSKNVLMPWLKDKLDNKARTNHGFAKKLDSSQSDASTALSTTDEGPNLSMQEQWGLPEWKDLGWFKGYENANFSKPKKQQRIGAKSHSKDTGDGVTWLDDEECKFYEEIYQAAEAEAEAEEDDNESYFQSNNSDSDVGGPPDDLEDEERDFTVTSNGKEFYSNDGELLYRI